MVPAKGHGEWMLSWNVHWVLVALRSNTAWTQSMNLSTSGRWEEAVLCAEHLLVLWYMCKGRTKASYCHCPHICLLKNARCKWWICCLLELADGRGGVGGVCVFSGLVPQLSLHGTWMALCLQGKFELGFLQLRTFLCAGIPDVGTRDLLAGFPCMLHWS